ncbi:hypothetical protein QUO90_002529 [Enterococcus faecium]|uniref:hypothetical protein n=1 Tax=Enterococcus faecium TaxID=1352 RepID=UPI0019DFB489|nr:hypothetical protein [Enterococcus faecium]EME3574929.1 hypothetical protein [Enterococcus faecium]EME8074858.1 hypothetical protein [Enterococcus faecium]
MNDLLIIQGTQHIYLKNNKYFFFEDADNNDIEECIQLAFPLFSKLENRSNRKISRENFDIFFIANISELKKEISLDTGKDKLLVFCDIVIFISKESKICIECLIKRYFEGCSNEFYDLVNDLEKTVFVFEDTIPFLTEVMEKLKKLKIGIYEKKMGLIIHRKLFVFLIVKILFSLLLVV